MHYGQTNKEKEKKTEAQQRLVLYLLLKLLWSVICRKLWICESQTTHWAAQQVSCFVHHRSDQMADSHRRRHFESPHCIWELLPSDLSLQPGHTECVWVFNVSFTESITVSHGKMTPRESEGWCAVCVRETGTRAEEGQTQSKGKIGTDSWTDGRTDG